MTTPVISGITPTAAEWSIMTLEERAEYKRQAVFAVFGHDVKFDRSGAPIEQGIGSKGNETPQHWSALERAEGAAAVAAAKARAEKRATR